MPRQSEMPEFGSTPQFVPVARTEPELAPPDPAESLAPASESSGLPSRTQPGKAKTRNRTVPSARMPQSGHRAQRLAKFCSGA